MHKGENGDSGDLAQTPEVFRLKFQWATSKKPNGFLNIAHQKTGIYYDLLWFMIPSLICHWIFVIFYLPLKIKNQPGSMAWLFGPSQWLSISGEANEKQCLSSRWPTPGEWWMYLMMMMMMMMITVWFSGSWKNVKDNGSTQIPKLFFRATTTQAQSFNTPNRAIFKNEGSREIARYMLKNKLSGDWCRLHSEHRGIYARSCGHGKDHVDESLRRGVPKGTKAHG